MIRPVKTVLFGLADPGQALAAGPAGSDAAVIDAAAVGVAAAARVAAALPPLAARLALVAPGAPLPPGFGGAVTGPADPRPPGALARVVRVAEGPVEELPADAEALWVTPRPGEGSTSTAFDFTRLERLGQRRRLILELPDGAAGVETAIRLARPYAVLFGEAVWFQRGIVDLDRLERALAVVARLNKAAYL